MMTFDEIFYNMVRDEYITCGYRVKYYHEKRKRKKRYIITDFDKEEFIELDGDIKKSIDNFVLEEVIAKKKKVYDVMYMHEEILKNVFDGIAYHVSRVENRTRILNEGLKANGNVDYDVLLTSCYLDSHKTKNIPKEFFRSACVYLYPKFSMYRLGFEEKNDIEEDLYAVDISNMDWRIASVGVSGFCLYCGESKEEYLKWFDSEWLKKNAKTYWKHCYSKEEYLNKTAEIERADKYYGIDEILCMEKLKAVHIGTFMHNGFVPKNNFKDFVKDEYKNIYYEVLKKI